jgi:SNF2 family DNA or RNA helicase
LLLEGLCEPTDKVIVFSQYVGTLRWLSARIPELPRDIYHGGLSEAERDVVVRRFQNDSGPRVLLMSLRAGGVGLNLQAASAAVLFDRWWNPAVEEQAIQRAHRFGRTRPLHAIRFLVTDTIEERIAEVLREKQVLFEQYVDQAESATVEQLSRTELRRILGLTAADVDQDITD